MKKIVLAISGIVFVALVVVVVVFVGQLEENVQSLQPDIRNITLEWGEITENSVEIMGTLTVYNPNSVLLPNNQSHLRC